MRRRFCRLGASLLLLSLLVTSCGSKNSGSIMDLRGRLINAPEDFYLDLCNTGERLWVALYALEPWFPQISGTADGGTAVGLSPPLFVDMTAKVESNGPYGHATKTSRAVVEIETMRSITPDIPSDCTQ